MSNQSKHFKKHSSDFKLKVVLKYLSEKFTIAEICVEFGISKATLHNWVTQFKAASSAVFNGNKAFDKTKEKQQKEITNLYTKIGELTVERDFLKKVLDA
jgi:transposase